MRSSSATAILRMMTGMLEPVKELEGSETILSAESISFHCSVLDNWQIPQVAIMSRFNITVT